MLYLTIGVIAYLTIAAIFFFVIRAEAEKQEVPYNHLQAAVALGWFLWVFWYLWVLMSEKLHKRA